MNKILPHITKDRKMSDIDKEIIFLKKTIKAYNRMMIAYRLGGNLPDWVHEQLDATEKRYGDLSKII